MLRAYIHLAVTFSVLITSCNNPKQADLIVHNALVYTVDSAFNTAESFAVRNGRFIAIGPSDEILSTYRAKETVDAQSQPVYPGFYDAHAHFFGLAQTFGQADLTGAKSYEEVIDRPPGVPWQLSRLALAARPWVGSESLGKQGFSRSFPVR